MKAQKLENTLLDGVKTKEEVGEICAQVDRLLEDLYKNPSQSFEKHMSSLESTHPLLRKIKTNALDVNDIATVLEKDKNDLIQLKYVKLIISFSPSNSFLGRIKEWVGTNINNARAIDVVVDSSIGGGVIVENEGAHIDLSLSTLLNNYFNQNRDALISEL
jgi:F0F1-type ATP synthase delta subunit